MVRTNPMNGPFLPQPYRMYHTRLALPGRQNHLRIILSIRTGQRVQNGPISLLPNRCPCDQVGNSVAGGNCDDDRGDDMRRFMRWLRQLCYRTGLCQCGAPANDGRFCSDQCEQDAIWQSAW